MVAGMRCAGLVDLPQTNLTPKPYSHANRCEEGKGVEEEEESRRNGK